MIGIALCPIPYSARWIWTQTIAMRRRIPIEIRTYEPEFDWLAERQDWFLYHDARLPEEWVGLFEGGGLALTVVFQDDCDAMQFLMRFPGWRINVVEYDDDLEHS